MLRPLKREQSLRVPANPLSRGGLAPIFSRDCQVRLPGAACCAPTEYCYGKARPGVESGSKLATAGKLPHSISFKHSRSLLISRL